MKLLIRVHLLTLLCFLAGTTLAHAVPPDPPKNVKVTFRSDDQVALRWDRGADHSKVDYLLYQKYANYNSYGAYHGYLTYTVYIAYPDYLAYNTYTAYVNFAAFPQAQYNNLPGFERNKDLNQYRFMHKIPVTKSSGSGDISGFLDPADPLTAYEAYWTYSKQYVTYFYGGPLPEATLHDERGRQSADPHRDPIFKVVTETGKSTKEGSLASAESEGRRRDLDLERSRPTLPAPYDVFTRRLPSGNVRLYWTSDVSGHTVAGNAAFHIYRNLGNYPDYWVYAAYQSYSDFLLDSIVIADIDHEAPNKLSLDIPATHVKPALHESTYKGARVNSLGVYKVSAAVHKPNTMSPTASPFSPESRYARPTITVDSGLDPVVMVGELLEIRVEVRNAENAIVEATAFDSGGSGRDIKLFKKSTRNLNRATFKRQSDGSYLFKWRPSHDVDEENLTLRSKDPTLKVPGSELTVVIHTVP